MPAGGHAHASVPIRGFPVARCFVDPLEKSLACDGLWQGDFLRRPVDIRDPREDEQPFHGGCPEEDCADARRVVDEGVNPLRRVS